jgi:hypothetical protein
MGGPCPRKAEAIRRTVRCSSYVIFPANDARRIDDALVVDRGGSRPAFGHDSRRRIPDGTPGFGCSEGALDPTAGSVDGIAQTQ